MKKLLLIPLMLFVAGAHAASPADGELNETAGALVFGGGPFVVPNPTSDVENLADGPLVCDLPMSCDEFALTVNISDEFREDEANKKEGVLFSLNFTAANAALDAQADFELYLFDSAGTKVISSVSGAGVPESFRIALSTLKNGTYTVTVVPYQPLGGSYTVDIALDKDRKKSATVSKEGSGLLAGAFAPFGLLILGVFGLFSAKRIHPV